MLFLKLQKKTEVSKMWLPLLGLIIGILIGHAFGLSIPPGYVKYMGVSVLAALDSVFGGIRAQLEDKYDNTILVTGFFTNIFLAAMLTYIGDRIGVDLYYAAVFAFGVRLFNNFGHIRRDLLTKYWRKK